MGINGLARIHHPYLDEMSTMIVGEQFENRPFLVPTIMWHDKKKMERERENIAIFCRKYGGNYGFWFLERKVTKNQTRYR